MVEASYTLDDGERVRCLEVTRSLPGKRKVFLGEYRGKHVFVKLFLDPGRGERHWTRELNGLATFEKCRIKTAGLIHSGRTAEDGYPVIILENLSGATSIKDSWEEADTEGRIRLLEQMTILLAQHHNNGLLQTDLHLGNFMLVEDEIVSLDGAGVKQSTDGVSKSDGIDNLGLFMAQLTPEWELKVPEVCRLYWAERGWADHPESELLLGRVQKWRQKRWRKFRNKLFRNTSAFSYEKQAHGFRVVVREFLSDSVSELLDNPDASYPGKKRAIKNGNSSTVWATQVDGMHLVIKRYNPKGIWHAMKLWLSHGRGGRSWVNANRLLFYGIPTPQPIALVKLGSGIRPVVYKITQEVKGISAAHWFRDPLHDVDKKRQMAGKIANALSSLHKQKLSHGDMKASNILISDDDIWLIDLDAMRQHSLQSTFNYARSSDIRRFMENWTDDHDLGEMFKNAVEYEGIKFSG